MTITYYLTATASDLSVPGAHFDNALSTTSPATTLAITVSNNTTETDYGYTAVGVPGVNGATGDYSVVVEINSGNADLECSIQLCRVNSGGTVQNSSGFSAEQNASAGPLTFNFTALDLGTWSTGDRLRVDFRMRDTSIHSNENFTYDLGSGTTGTRVVTPFTTPTPTTRYFIIS